MKLTVDNQEIPDWLRPHMRIMCKCGVGVMVDDGPIGADGVMKLTQRWCSNPKCPYHMAEKIDMLAKRLGVDGVGPATAREEIIQFGYQIHLDALRVWFRDKPQVYLWEAAEMSYIFGVDSKWREWLEGYNSLDEYYASNIDIPEPMIIHRDYLYDCVGYFNIRKSKVSKSILKIMISGSIHGYRNRAEFLDAINLEFKDYFRVLDNKKTVRDTIALVIEPDSVDYSKTNIARLHGIPVMSSVEFLALLNQIKEELICGCQSS